MQLGVDMRVMQVRVVKVWVMALHRSAVPEKQFLWAGGESGAVMRSHKSGRGVLNRNCSRNYHRSGDVQMTTNTTTAPGSAATARRLAEVQARAAASWLIHTAAAADEVADWLAGRSTDSSPTS